MKDRATTLEDAVKESINFYKEEIERYLKMLLEEIDDAERKGFPENICKNIVSLKDTISEYRIRLDALQDVLVEWNLSR